jgi:alanyl-tRNA synthetase
LHGRLTVKCDRPPSETELQRIESLANEKIRADVEIEELEMDRAEAETRWGDDLYDLFPIPAAITRLRILHIPEWNVNACKEPHTKRTGEIRTLRLGKPRYRAGKQLLEVPFDLLD